MRRLWIFIVIASLAPGATVAMALVDQKNFNVLATVQTPASVSMSVDPLVFGEVIETSSSDHSGCTPGFSTIHITATAGKSYTIVHDAGLTHNSQMHGVSDPSHLLSFILFTQPDHESSPIFGVIPIIGTGNGSVQHIPIYAGVPPTQHVTNQDYTDTVTLTATINP